MLACRPFLRLAARGRYGAAQRLVGGYLTTATRLRPTVDPYNGHP